jgi:hypothetical protein
VRQAYYYILQEALDIITTGGGGGANHERARIREYPCAIRVKENGIIRCCGAGTSSSVSAAIDCWRRTQRRTTINHPLDPGQVFREGPQYRLDDSDRLAVADLMEGPHHPDPE